ncbi:MAG: hypothetical protein IPM16_21300 [Chloroflexi bacterium]|nr:hypothetical protein [Chloroflexota bacterium]
MSRASFGSIAIPLVHAAIAVIVLALATSKFGLGISADSVEYLSMAENFAETGRLANYRNELLTVFPPLYTVSISLISGALDAATSAHVLALLLFGVLIFALSTAVRNLTGSRTMLNRAAYHMLVAALVFSPVFAVSRFAWSESMYIVISVAQFWVMRSLLRQPSLAGVVGASMLAGAAAMTRYIGVVNIGTLLFAVLYLIPTQTSRKLGYVAVTIAVSGIAIGLWMFRNYGVDQTILGPRYPSDVGVVENTQRVVTTLMSWIVPYPLASKAALALPGFVLGATATAWMIWRNRTRLDSRLLLLLTSYTVLFAGWMVISASSYAFDAINTRLMAPVFLPLYFIVVQAVKAQLMRGAGSLSLVKTLSAIVLTLVVLVHFSKDLVMPIQNGAGGYNSVDVQSTRDLALSLRDVPEGARHASHPDLVYWLTAGELVVDEIPRQWEFNAPRAVVATIDDLRGNWPGQIPAHMLIYPGRVYQFGIDQLGQIAEITFVARNGIASMYVATERINP